MSPAEYIYVEEHRKAAREIERLERERCLHRWVAEGKVTYNITKQRYTVGCDAHAVHFSPVFTADDIPFPTERFIADLALAIQSIPCRPVAIGAQGDPLCKLGTVLR